MRQLRAAFSQPSNSPPNASTLQSSHMLFSSAARVWLTKKGSSRTPRTAVSEHDHLLSLEGGGCPHTEKQPNWHFISNFEPTVGRLLRSIASILPPWWTAHTTNTSTRHTRSRIHGQQTRNRSGFSYRRGAKRKKEVYGETNHRAPRIRRMEVLCMEVSRSFPGLYRQPHSWTRGEESKGERGRERERLRERERERD